jgi:FkbM family methyltransferase
MHFKILKKIVGIFGFKLTSKNLIKVERILASNDSLSIDRILINIFNTKKMTGLVQIGANDGLRFDNINKYIKKYKPKSILVEPIKEYFNELKKNYKNYENIFFENIAISTNEQINYLYKVKSTDLDKYDEHIKGISSFDIKHLITHGVKKNHITKEETESMSIVNLFKKYDFDIDLLLIDAEGYDSEIVIDLFQNSNFRPIIIFEYIHVKFKSIKILKNLFNTKKYKYLKINENLVCVPNEILLNIDF